MRSCLRSPASRDALERAAFRWAWLVCYRRGVPRWYQIMAWALWVQSDRRGGPGRAWDA